MGFESKSDKEETYGVYQGILFPIIVLVFVTFIPEPSLLIAVLSGIYCAVLILFVLISKAKKWHRSRKFRILFGLTHIDVPAILVAIMAARVMEGSVGVFLLVMGIFLLAFLQATGIAEEFWTNCKNPKPCWGNCWLLLGPWGEDWLLFSPTGLVNFCRG